MHKPFLGQGYVPGSITHRIYDLMTSAVNNYKTVFKKIGSDPAAGQPGCYHYKRIYFYYLLFWIPLNPGTFHLLTSINFY